MIEGVSDGTSRVERFLAHLDGLTGVTEPRIWPVESTRPGSEGLTAIHYSHVPEPGTSLGFTYGLSRGDDERWRDGKPELCIRVASDDPSWTLAAAFLAEDLRGRCAFRYGDVLEFGQPVTAGSTMDGFVVSAPAVADQRDARIDVGEELPITLVGLYPTHRSERAFVQEHGLHAFWRLDWDPFDVRRPAAA